MDWNLTYTKKEWEELLYENGTGKKIVSHFKLKLWTFFWGHGEHEWPLVTIIIVHVQQLSQIFSLFIHVQVHVVD